MKRLIVSIALIAIAVLWGQAALRSASQGAGAVPSVIYLGETGSYTIPADSNYIVKRTSPFRFDLEPPTDYTAAPNERVWQMTGLTSAPPAVYHDEAFVGNVEAGCVVRYAVIDDDLDGIRNHFRINGILIHTIDEGMVSAGEFVAPFSGALNYDANDSSGLYVEFCEDIVQLTATPTATYTPTATGTATATATATQPPTETPTATATPEVTATPAMSVTPTVSVTLTASPTPSTTPIVATPTLVPSATPTQTPEPTATAGFPTPTLTPTPTKEPRLKACLRINFEVSGDVALPGTYSVHEFGGRHLTSWHAQAGWQDSGWIRELDISYPSVYVDVIFTPDDGGPAVKMAMLNAAPGTTGGWLSRGVCHALEVGWPEGYPPPADSSDNGGGGDSAVATPTQESVWPGQEPTETPEPGSGSLSSGLGR